MHYTGAAVRKLIVGNHYRHEHLQIQTTNEAPPSAPILFHHESAHTQTTPDHIAFFCKEIDAIGGSTPLIRSDMVYDWLAEKYPEFLEKIETMGVKY